MITCTITLSSFNYCPIVSMLSSPKSPNKIESIARISIVNDYANSYEDFLEKSSCCSVRVRKILSICVEMFETLNNLSPVFMQNIFELHEENFGASVKLRIKSKWICLYQTEIKLDPGK